MTNCCGVQLADRNLEVRLLSFLLRCDHADQSPNAANGQIIGQRTGWACYLASTALIASLSASPVLPSGTSDGNSMCSSSHGDTSMSASTTSSEIT